MGGMTTEVDYLPWDKAQPQQYSKLHDRAFMFDVKKKAFVDLQKVWEKRHPRYVKERNLAKKQNRDF